MSVSQVSQSTPLSKDYRINQNTVCNPDEVAAFEATLSSLEATSENSSTNDQNFSQESTDPSIPEASWEAVHKGFNNLIFQETRRQLDYYDQKRKEIDYGNKP